MAIIPLRQYNREIEGMIESGQFPEAIAHCRHILSTYPKHIQTYRLLGKIFLETQQYTDATDIFQRLLIVIPDDFIAHVGMSIIREDENNIEAAIWHMERAFETQPANPAIQEELRRLYGRRDGIEPPKIRLTRGALARMYARGNLSEQAIAELRAALSDDPQRVELQVLLAQMYYQTRQFIEAINICSAILKKYPYCQEANRLLAIILPETDRSQDAEIYRQRLRAMDPYYASASPTALTSDDVPENAVMIEQLIYRSRETASGTPDQPAWASALGIAFSSKTSDQIPEWLHENETLIPPITDTPKPPVVAPFSWEKPSDVIPESHTASQQEDIIPDWMKEAGWEPGNKQVNKSEVPFEVDETESEITKGEIPDWLRNLAPEGVLDKEVLPPEEEKDDLSMPWLLEKEPGASDTITNWLSDEKTEEPTVGPETIPPAAASGLAAWLYANDRGAEEEEKKTPPSPDDEQLPAWLIDLEKPVEGPSGVTDWLRTATLPEESPQAAGASEQEYSEPINVPDWLEEIPSDIEAISEPLEPEFDNQEAAEPSFVQELEPGASGPLGSLEALPPDESHLTDNDAALAWLENLAAQQGAKEEELITPLDERLTNPPDWVRGEEIPEPLQMESPAPPLTGEIPDWLQELEQTEGTQPPTPIPAEEIDHEQLSQSLPGWLRDAEQIEDESSVTTTLPIPESNGESDIPEWLRAAAIAKEIITTEKDESDDSERFPEWLHDLGAEETEIPAAHSELPVADEDIEPIEIPDWLRAADEVEDVTIPTDEINPVEVAAGIPDWLPESEEPVSEPAPPTDLPPDSAPLELDEQDAALAWLESLAAQQGVDEQELITRPEDRLETPPDWVIEQSEAEAETELTADLEEIIIPEWIKEEIETESQPVQQAEPMEWEQGESLSKDLDVHEEKPLSEELPAWLQDEPSLQTTLPAEEGALEEELPVWLQEEAALQAAEQPGVAAQGEELPAWLQEETVVESIRGLDERPPDETLHPQLQEEPPSLVPQATEESVQLEELPVRMQAEMTPPMSEVTQDVLPVNLNTASLGELERLPGIGFVLAQNILAYRTEQGTISSMDELATLEGFTPETLDAIRNLVSIEIEPTPQAMPLPDALSDQEAVLISARQAMETGQCSLALGEYAKLIKDSVHLDTIIHELQDALYHYPLDINIWQVLGDAYMRNMDLQQALDAYIKAEDLLR